MAMRRDRDTTSSQKMGRGARRQGSEKAIRSDVRSGATSSKSGQDHWSAGSFAPVAKAAIERALMAGKMANRARVRFDPHDLDAVYVHADDLACVTMSEFRVMLARALDDHHSHPASAPSVTALNMWLRR